MDVIYQPPFGKERHMRFRQNFRYGDDDPLLWPQPYVVSECHLAAIPMRPDASDRMAVMWWQLTREGFSLSTRGIVTGIGLISSTKLAQISRLVKDLQSRATAYLKNDRFPKKAEGVMVLSNALEQGITRLESLPMSLQQAGFCLSHVQRLYLELVALLDYITIYKLRIDGHLPAATQVASTMGVITENPMVAQDFIRAGLPVWLIRSYKEVPATRIDALKMPRQPADLCMEDAHLAHDTMFVGKADDPNKYLTISRYIHYFFRYPNPFDLINKPANAPFSSASSTSPSVQSVSANKSANAPSLVQSVRVNFIHSSSSSITSTPRSAAPIGKVRNSSQGQSARTRPCRYLLWGQ